MIGLFQEHGPCRITNDSSSVTLNIYSWNNEANMLYIDQPVGTGFSYGELNVGTSEEAAADIWTFIQIFLSDPRFDEIWISKACYLDRVVCISVRL
jgi:carboxypeptidase C (cathepsin A)